jgi:hypothetical protein
MSQGLKSVCVAATVKAPKADLEAFANYHFSLGIGRIIFFFDDPQDPAAAALQTRKGISCIRCDPSYWLNLIGDPAPHLEARLVANANHALALARDEGFDWLISIDNDELVYPLTSFSTLLSKTTADVLRFTVNEAVPISEDYQSLFAPREFKIQKRYIGRLAQLLGCRIAYFNGEYFRGHIASKAAYRVSSPVQLTDTHGPLASTADVIVEQTKEILLLHYDCVDFKTWERKWRIRLDDDSALIALRGNRKRQVALFKDASEQGEDAVRQVYRRLYMMPRYERFVLSVLGLLRKRVIDPEAFRQPQSGVS